MGCALVVLVILMLMFAPAIGDAIHFAEGFEYVIAIFEAIQKIEQLQRAWDLLIQYDVFRTVLEAIGLDFWSECRISEKFPPEIQNWCKLVTQYSDKRNPPLDPDLVSAVIWIESKGKPSARSRCDATGLMQIMPSDLTPQTIACGALSCGREGNQHCFPKRPTIEELLDPETNIMWGTRLLSSYYNHYGNYRDALKRYGPSNVGYTYADLVLEYYRSMK
jgi:soluble lytic murein transglycosylase-like protein